MKSNVSEDNAENAFPQTVLGSTLKVARGIKMSHLFHYLPRHEGPTRYFVTRNNRRRLLPETRSIQQPTGR